MSPEYLDEYPAWINLRAKHAAEQAEAHHGTPDYEKWQVVADALRRAAEQIKAAVDPLEVMEDGERSSTVRVPVSKIGDRGSNPRALATDDDDWREGEVT